MLGNMYGYSYVVCTASYVYIIPEAVHVGGELISAAHGGFFSALTHPCFIQEGKCCPLISQPKPSSASEEA